jgi:hypothetical protein
MNRESGESYEFLFGNEEGRNFRKAMDLEAFLASSFPDSPLFLIRRIRGSFAS